jgi:general secretion pathway protein N
MMRRVAAVIAALALTPFGRRGATLLLGVLCCALATIVVLEIGSGAGEATSPSLSAAPLPPLPPLPAAFSLPPLARYAEVAERPLFSATRQRPPAEAGQDLLGKSSSFVLLGVILSERGRAALVQHGHPSEMARVTEGQAVEGWTVQSILPDRILLQHGATDVELKLKDLPPVPSAARPPPPRG